jgi:N-acetylmuramoyl-L-alanine amidase
MQILFLRPLNVEFSAIRNHQSEIGIMPDSAQSNWLQKLWDFLRRLFGAGEKPAPPSTPTPEPEPEPEPEPNGRFIAIDAGHGGDDTGAINQAAGINEKTVTLAISQQLQRILESRGHEVLMTRRTDVFVPLGQRAELANTAATEIFASIHCNSAENAGATGIETYHHANSAMGKALAAEVHAALIAAFPSHQNRGVKSANFQVLRETQMPACLVETEFISNPQQAQFLANPANQEKIARAIADGIKTYFQQ